MPRFVPPLLHRTLRVLAVVPVALLLGACQAKLGVDFASSAPASAQAVTLAVPYVDLEDSDGGYHSYDSVDDASFDVLAYADGDRKELLSEDDASATYTGVRARFDVAAHRLELDIAVEEIACARPDQHVERNQQALARDRDRRVRGREAAFAEARAKLDASCAAVLRRERGRDRVRCDFEQRCAAGHRLRPCCARESGRPASSHRTRRTRSLSGWPTRRHRRAC